MKAWLLKQIGDISFEDVEEAPVSSNEVRVKVKAAGICGSDIPRVYETGAHKMPLICGHEFSGIVDGTGAEADRKCDKKRVGVFPLIPCGKCKSCRQKKYELCRDYDYVGSRRNGAFAEYVNVPEWNLIELPENVPFDAAAMLEPMAVAVHAARLGTEGFTLQYDSRITVCGLGTIGSFVVMFLKDAGYQNVYAVCKHEYQAKRAEMFGIGKENIFTGSTLDAGKWIRQKLDDTDVFFECVGKNETVSLGIECTGASGRVVLLGNPFSDMTMGKDIYWKILRNQLTVTGSWNSTFDKSRDDDWHYVIERLAEGDIHPELMISHRLPLERLEEGMHIMRDKSEEYGKLMVCM